jgi:tetratricopeptide (TPR) repeat protein
MFEKLFRSFRATLNGEGREEFTLEEEIALYRYRADLALQEERWSDALVFLAKILRLNPYDLQARMAVAWTYHYKLGEPTKALLTYEKVIAAAGYDESNSYSAAAREGIRELAFSAEVPSLPMDGLLDEESGAESSGDAPRSAAV